MWTILILLPDTTYFNRCIFSMLQCVHQVMFWAMNVSRPPLGCTPPPTIQPPVPAVPPVRRLWKQDQRAPVIVVSSSRLAAIRHPCFCDHQEKRVLLKYVYFSTIMQKEFLMTLE